MTAKLFRGLLPCLFLGLSFLTLSNCTKEDTNPKLVYVHDTIVRNDTVHHRDTIIRGDTVFVRDTVLVRDTIYVPIDTTPSRVQPVTFRNVTLGAQTSVTGSFYSSSLGRVYPTIDSANFVTNLVDISFAVVGSVNQLPMFISLAERRNQGLSRAVTINRSTFFGRTNFTFSEFDTVSDNYLHAIPASASYSVITVEPGVVYGYINPEGRKGLAYIHAIGGSSLARTVTISTKLQR